MGNKFTKCRPGNAGEAAIWASGVSLVWRDVLKDSQHNFVLTSYLKSLQADRSLVRVLRLTDVEEPREDLALLELSERVRRFLAELIENDLLLDEAKLRRACHTCGVRHAGYSGSRFKVEYWDLFLNSMMATLDEYETVTRRQKRAWKSFVELVIVHMKSGYNEGRAVQHSLSAGATDSLSAANGKPSPQMSRRGDDEELAFESNPLKWTPLK